MTDAPEPQKRPTWVQGLFIVGAGLLLGIGGCATFLASLDSDSEVIAFIGGGAFLLGVLGVVVGGVWFTVGVFKRLFAN